IKLTTYILIGVLLTLSDGFAQNKKELLNYGDKSFADQNYVAAAYFYGKVVGSYMTGEQDLVYPYEFMSWNEPLKVEEADTANIDSNKVAETPAPEPIDTTEAEPETALDKVKDDEGYKHALYHLAESYRLSYNYNNAEAVYKQCIDLELEEYPLLHFWYALSMKKNMKYAEAQKEFDDFIKATKATPYTDSLGTNYYKRAKKEKSGCRQAVEWIEEPVAGVRVKKMDSIFNNGTASFSASYYNEEASVLYATARAQPEAAGKGLRKVESCNIYTFSYDQDSAWANPKKFIAPINSIKHEGGMSISSNESKIFFTRWGESDGRKECHIYLSKNFNGRWLPAQKLRDNVNITGYTSMHPYVTPDGTKLFYSSNRPGGKGRMDLWYCEMDEMGNLGNAINVGWPINTKEDEVSPMYLEEEKTLYFSSNGHVGMGGLDIFEAFGELSELYRPINLGYPINSSKDDKFFVLNKSVNKGFLSSDRNDCPECEGGNCLELFEVDYGPPMFALSGHVYTKLNKKPIANALVTVKDVNEYYEPFFIITDAEGYYFTPLRREMIYYLKAQKVKFFADATDVSTKGLDRSQEFIRDFFLPRIPIGEIEIKGIEYDYDKWDLRPASKVTLDSLVFFLGVNDNITIELSSHTDNRGQDDYNETLSQKRAQSVVDYLVKQGIPLDRLTPVGYGEKKPVIKDAETEEEHQKNRRTAFEVLRQDYVQLKNRK
ncbi:MAG: OmpA family protein, partial [Flavobacteriales bacterium]|nr:OmpA family protein [Flavobacteriales bacterium]